MGTAANFLVYWKSHRRHFHHSVWGFATLMLSSFEGTFHIGLLVSLTLCFAVAVDLAVLPLLLLPRRSKALLN